MVKATHAEVDITREGRHIGSAATRAKRWRISRSLPFRVQHSRVDNVDNDSANVVQVPGEDDSLGTETRGAHSTIGDREEAET